MDELEKLLAFIGIEMNLVQELEQIDKIEAQHLKNLNNWFDAVLNTSSST